MLFFHPAIFSHLADFVKRFAYLVYGVLTTFINKNMVFVCPPLCITEPELLDGLKIIERAIAAAATPA
jgi:4-aminobutyrate aminotransferase-like enzyme